MEYVEQWGLTATFDGDAITIIARGIVPGTPEEPVTFDGVLAD